MSTSPPPPAFDFETIRASFAPRLIAWQREHGRHALPWQRTRDPYRVWLSEIMLQQTQVATVLSYYDRFLARFPDVAALAAAPQDEVLAAWAGLGYYSRARNLHRCAQQVMSEHGGTFPCTAARLQELPGIGRSTAAAIAAFCFGERAAILDGNVKRVLSRVLGFGDDLAVARHEQALWTRATEMLPTSEGIESYTQGLMDLGATICQTRSPSCLLCPMQNLCTARLQHQPEAYPVKTRKLKRKRRENWWLWLEHAGRVHLVQRPETGVWAGLYSLPEYDSEAGLQAALRAWPDHRSEPQPTVQHALTHFDWVLHPLRVTLTQPAPTDLPGGRWVDYDRLGDYGLPAPVRKLLQGA